MPLLMRIFKRSSMDLPLAFSVQPSGTFDQGDGNWSTFNLAVGSGSGGPQNFRVVVSTSSFDTWLPVPEDTGCPSTSVSPATCASMRGVGLYEGSQSTGFQGNRSNTALSTGQLGIETLDIGQLDASTLFGKEYGDIKEQLWADYIYLTTSTSPSTSHNSSSRAPIFGIGSVNYYLASFGVGYGALESTVGLALNSTLSGMAATGAIPSVSWGYTAGAYYDNQRLGSLVLGGYDQARIIGTPAQFSLTAGTARSSELLLSVSSISIQYSNGNGPASSPAPFEAVIDSTLPYMFLPNATCDWLKDRLGLNYDNSTGLYTINQTSLDSNRAGIATFSILLGPSSQSTTTSNSIISIKFPYDAFNAVASWPWGYTSSQTIFPILRAQSNIAVLGRPFFQEAYVSADYERNIFNVSQTTSQIVGSQLVNLYNASTQALIDSGSSKKLSKGDIAGIIIGPSIVLAAIVLFFWWWFSKRRGQKRKGGEDPKHKSDMALSERLSSAVTEIGLSDGRPAHNRQMSGVSEMSSDSEFARRRNTLGTLNENIHELEGEDKTDTAEWERNVARNQQPQTPTELEGEGHLILRAPMRAVPANNRIDQGENISPSTEEGATNNL